MNFLRALFWIVLTVVVVVFSMRNWIAVPVSLFGGLVADVKLPVLLLATFLLGWAPAYGWHRWQRWRLERRLQVAERALVPATTIAFAGGEATLAPPLATPPHPTIGDV